MSVLYAASLPGIYWFAGPLIAFTIAMIMLASVSVALLLATRQQRGVPAKAKPLTEREARLFSFAQRVVLICAVASLITWASIAGFYWELRSYFLVPGLISCIFVALAIYGVMRPNALSGNIMRFQMMAAFGYVLAIPVIVAGVMLARMVGVGTSVAIFGLLPMMAAGFFVQRWRERAVAAGAA